MYKFSFYPELRVNSYVLTFSDDPSTRYLVLGYIPISIYEGVIEDPIWGVVSRQGFADSFLIGKISHVGFSQEGFTGQIDHFGYQLDEFTGQIDHFGYQLDEFTGQTDHQASVNLEHTGKIEPTRTGLTHEVDEVGVKDLKGNIGDDNIAAIKPISLGSFQQTFAGQRLTNVGLVSKITYAMLSRINALINKQTESYQSPKESTVLSTTSGENSPLNAQISTEDVPVSKFKESEMVPDVKSGEPVKWGSEILDDPVELTRVDSRAIGQALESTAFRECDPMMQNSEITTDWRQPKVLVITHKEQATSRQKIALRPESITISSKKELLLQIDNIRSGFKVTGSGDTEMSQIAFKIVHEEQDIKQFQAQKTIISGFFTDNLDAKKTFYRATTDKALLLWRVINKSHKISDGIGAVKLFKDTKPDVSGSIGVKIYKDGYQTDQDLKGRLINKSVANIPSDIVGNKRKKAVTLLAKQIQATKSRYFGDATKSVWTLLKTPYQIINQDELLMDDVRSLFKVSKVIVVSEDKSAPAVESVGDFVQTTDADKLSRSSNYIPASTDGIKHEHSSEQGISLSATSIRGSAVELKVPNTTVKRERMLKVFTQTVGNSLSQAGNILSEQIQSLTGRTFAIFTQGFQGIRDTFGQLLNDKLSNVAKFFKFSTTPEAEKVASTDKVAIEERGSKVTKPRTTKVLIQKLVSLFGETRSTKVLIQKLVSLFGETRSNRPAVLEEHMEIAEWDELWQDIWKLYGKGIDKLQLPDRDYYYAKNASDIWDHETGEVYQGLSPVNMPMVRVSKCVGHPLPQFSEVGREDHEMKRLVIKANVLVDMMLLVRQQIKYNMRQYLIMTAQDALMNLLERLRYIVEVVYHDDPQYKRAFQMVRWYAESVVLHNSKFYVNRTYDQWISKEQHGYIGEPEEVVNEGWAITQDTLIHTQTYGATLTLKLKNWIDGYLSFSSMTNHNDAKIDLYIDNVKIMTVRTVNQMRHWVPAGQHEIKFVFTGPPGMSGYLSGIGLEGYRFINAEMVIKPGDDKMDGFRAVEAVLTKLLKYYVDHHFQKTKGSRNSWLKRITQIKVDD